jgi:hypothetical protein
MARYPGGIPPVYLQGLRIGASRAAVRSAVAADPEPARPGNRKTNPNVPIVPISAPSQVEQFHTDRGSIERHAPHTTTLPFLLRAKRSDVHLFNRVLKNCGADRLRPLFDHSFDRSCVTPPDDQWAESSRRLFGAQYAAVVIP